MRRVADGVLTRGCVTALLAIVLLAAVPVSGAHGATGAISGTVTGGGGPLRGIAVEVLKAGTGNYAYVGTATTDATGHYALSGLNPGGYYLRFVTTAYNAAHGTAYAQEYYDDLYVRGYAATVTVGDGLETAGINADLEEVGSITGTITGVAGPAPGIGAVAIGALYGDVCGMATSDASGFYRMTGLPPQDYIVKFTHLPRGNTVEYYNDTYVIGDATPVPVASGATAEGIDAYVLLEGAIGGAVRGDSGPLVGVTVRLKQYTLPVAQAVTDAAGAYSFPGLVPGPYVIEFDPAAYNTANGTYYLPASARPTIFGGQILTGTDATLKQGGWITGTVTVDGLGKSGIEVRADNLDISGYGAVCTSGANGSYRVGPLLPGSYRVLFNNNSYDYHYLGEYYEDCRTAEGATRVPVASLEDSPGIDADLEWNTLLSGTVYGDEEPLSGVRVEAYEVGSDEPAGWAISDADGEYSITALPRGYYEVLYDPTDRNAASGTEFDPDYYWVGGSWPSSVLVEPRNDISKNVNGWLTAWTTAIGGRVTNGSGIPLEGIVVYAWQDTATALISDTTNANGEYVLNGLTAGRPYAVSFDPAGYNSRTGANLEERFYPNEYWVDHATWVTPVHGETTPNINGTLGGATTTPGLPQPVYRFYNRSNGTHFFTPSAAERDMVKARWSNVYTFEGVAYFTNPSNNTQPLYRLYNKRSGSHFYTPQWSEAADALAKWPAVFTYDGPTYAVNTSPVPCSTPVYRFYNRKNGSHFYTASEEERIHVIANYSGTYQFEGPAFWIGQ